MRDKIRIWLMFVILVIGIFGCAVSPNPGSIPPVPGAPSKLLSAGAVLATAGGVAAMTMGATTIGLPIVVGGLTTLVLMLTIAKYGAIIALAGVLVLLGGLAFLLLRQAKKYKTGFSEVVAGAQKVKDTLVKAGRAQKDEINKLLIEGIQSPKTQALVQEVKQYNS
jgi:predicted lipid-binding transport protein (Tim44 family)